MRCLYESNNTFAVEKRGRTVSLTQPQEFFVQKINARVGVSVERARVRYKSSIKHIFFFLLFFSFFFYLFI